MSKLFALLPAALIAAAPIASAQEVDPGVSVRERRTAHPVARILLLPLMPFVELQAELSPEKASCWNDRAGEVVGCRVVDEYEARRTARSTPYQF